MKKENFNFLWLNYFPASCTFGKEWKWTILPSKINTQDNPRTIHFPDVSISNISVWFERKHIFYNYMKSDKYFIYFSGGLYLLLKNMIETSWYYLDVT